MLKTIEHYLHADSFDDLHKIEVNRTCMEHISVYSNWGMKFLLISQWAIKLFSKERRGAKLLSIF